MTLDTTGDAPADANMSMEKQYQRRMSAPAAYATVPPDAPDALDTAPPPPPPRRSSLVGAYDYSNQHQDQPQIPTTTTTESRRSSIVEAPAAPAYDASTSVDTPPPSTSASTTDRKRTERRHGCETMFSMDTIFSRDLKITGVSKKGASWRYHIDVLDIRNSIMPFTDSFTSTTSRNSTAASSPASSSIASMASLPPAPPSTMAFTLPPLVRYSVMRRYNDFRQLYLYLVEYYGPELLDMLPKFPDGGLVSYFRGDDPKLLQYRKEQLQKFLRALDENEDTKWSRAFRVFLNPDIDELTGIGGESFATLVENYGSSNTTTNSTAAAPLSSSAASSSYWDGMGLSRINTTSGYVSLSHVKSPEIRFKKQPVEMRGDWKRRKIARANRGEDPADNDMGESDAKKPRRVKRLDLDEPQGDNQSDTGDDDDDDGESDSPKKTSTELMKLLSLAPVAEANQ